MATPHLSQGGNNSPEHRTMIQNKASLIDILSHSIQSLGDELLAAGLIPSELYHTVRESTNSQQATRNVISYLTAQIKINISTYHRFINILEKLGPWTKPLISKMTSCYDALNSSSDQASSDASGDKAYSSEQKEKQLTKSDFPFLDLGSLNEDQKIDLEQRLRADTKRMKINFSNFTVAIRDSLESRIALDKIKDTILSLDAFTDGIGTTVLDPQDVQDIKRAETVSAVFIILRKYISFFNYDIIVILISQYGTEEDKTKLQDYLREFKDFCKRNIYEVPSNAYSNSSRPEAKNIVVKCTDHVTSVQNVRQMKEQVADIMGLKYSALQLHTIWKGCFELHFFISAATATRLFPEVSTSSQYPGMDQGGGSSAGAGQGGRVSGLGQFGQVIQA